MGYQVGLYPYQNPNYVHQIQTVPTNEYDSSYIEQNLFFQYPQQQQQPQHLQQIPAQPLQSNTHHHHQQHPQQFTTTSPTTSPNSRKRPYDILSSPPNYSIQQLYSPNTYQIHQQQLQHQQLQQQQLQQQQQQQLQHIQSSPSSSAYNFVPISQPTTPPTTDIDEDIEEQLRDYLSPMFSKFFDQTTKEHLSTLIADFLNDELPLRSIINELRMMVMDDRSLLHYLIEIFIVMDTTNKMYSFLLENGVEEHELNIDTKNFAMLFDTENGFKKFNLDLQRERSRKSVSRGLRNPPNKWTKEESQRLIQLVHESGDKQWKKIAIQIGGGKTGAQCAQHWKRVLCPAIRKGSWDEEEEAKLFILVDKHGQSWKNVASEIRTRTDIQCRYQYFKSCMSREVPWSPKEDELLQKKVIECKQEGRDISWMDLSKAMARARQTKIPRTALECKSRWEAISIGSIVDGLDLSSNF
ncbi:putative myb transcription factor [Heterostelium album PN500]|uniref:Putative myb transcription factor n=1 Tax=Heterostelium pallidum (strain ATCC 26659 / Pp 5 / PN500) TaxID=670386 RepID=D3BT26_HETP5|nr:putative myb transcription factor [Heterostelium album PN500]EFA75243.1 putative myb transcription factor [Heterostelium album PN500]|eukprot:XP_020427377.1 putative myb transcription factor [Heterostelium album PN500]